MKGGDGNAKKNALKYLKLFLLKTNEWDVNQR